MIAFTGGGTGGHLAIVKALANEFKKRNIEFIFIGSTKGQDRAWFENDPIFKTKYFLESSGVVDKKGLGKLKSLLNIFKLSLKARQILKDNNIKAVISVGGYSSAPASFGAISLGIPFFIHEQNAFMGRLNKTIKPFAKRIYSSFSKNPFSYPVAKEFFDSSRTRESLNTIIFLGGSQGAKYINELALKLAPKLQEKNIKIIHQTGKNDFENIKKSYEELGINADVFDFSKEIHKKLNEADLAICRSGASSLWELVANKLPAIFIPFPFAANDHQYYNAWFLASKNLALVFRQKDLKEQDLLDAIFRLNLNTISKDLESQLLQDGAKKIADDIIEISKLN